MEISSIDNNSHILFHPFKKEYEDNINPLFLTTKVEVRIANLVTVEKLSIEKIDIDYIQKGLNNLFNKNIPRFAYEDLDKRFSLYFETGNNDEICINGEIRDIEYLYNLSFEFYTKNENIKDFLSSFPEIL
ncbi:hypothetical protein EGY07_12265 [Chryseobacterium indologenes]|uniref:hypothetical protein n=1 Tax=Chryseobacterium indologenes TaxID=253 RepID=UPI000F4D79A7|nr:hypothetical protein [Chryseobacterium indologenes]AYZ36298.1 hypothetical protein EGY07_12265 [Chryseobacterium indologenes]MBF6644947.1 hypothetical protein [Chryseobacterium indologenes]MEB4759223.1 hypothetical protein [Chryseobacterium indologenes]QQQ71370.1 hypothetical protein JHW31_01190 [Chryseobacterium indologenes]